MKRFLLRPFILFSLIEYLFPLSGIVIPTINKMLIQSVVYWSLLEHSLLELKEVFFFKKSILKIVSYTKPISSNIRPYTICFRFCFLLKTCTRVLTFVSFPFVGPIFQHCQIDWKIWQHWKKCQFSHSVCLA